MINPNSCPCCGREIQPVNSQGRVIGYSCPDRDCGVASIGVLAAEAYVKSREMKTQPMPLMVSD